MKNIIEFGDCRETMRRWASQGVKAQMCVTSPPYFGLRDYGHDGQIGLEQTLEEYIAAMVEVFRCVRDVLADDGTLWLNIGDSYGSGNSGHRIKGMNQRTLGRPGNVATQGSADQARAPIPGMHKQLLGIPWRVAFALQADGWYLRQDIIWHKPNPMPESVRDRCTKAHEYIFLLSKSERYFFDSDAMKEPAVSAPQSRMTSTADQPGAAARAKQGGQNPTCQGGTFTHRNRRSVWTVATSPYKGAHFATFPTALIEPCILAGSRPGDIVLDPFMGSGTTAQVALQHGRAYLGCELNPDYKALQDERIAQAKLDTTVNQLALPLEAMNAS